VEEGNDELEEALSREFYDLREDVYDRLRAADHVPHGWALRVGQLLVIPSFQNPYSWDILRDPEGVYSLHYTCWREDQDAAAFKSPAARGDYYPAPFRPTIEASPIPITSAQLDGLIAEFLGVSIPVGLAAPASGQDGVCFELLLGNLWGGCRLNWWCDLPREWGQLRPLIRRMMEMFEAARAGRGPAEPAAAADRGPHSE
jgi:hypothetical protein